MSVFYLDYENGNDANDGSNWALAWKTITNGAIAARIAAGDVIRIAKSPAPVSIGNAAWTNLSKTVTLASAQTLNVDMCEVAWTAQNGATVTRQGVATDAKQGSYCMQITAPAAPAVSTLYAYYPIANTDFSSYQKLSFWLKNEAEIFAGHWKLCLCSDTLGVTIVDEFLIPAIPNYFGINNWVPLTLVKNGGGNLGAAIQSVAFYSDTVAPTASKYVRLDNIIACTTNGLNLQSLISKNLTEQGGNEGWYGIQSLNGVTLLLDCVTNIKANEGRGYYGTTGTVTTYKRETIKTVLATSTSAVQTLQKDGAAGSLIEYQGGYNTTTTIQEGETFFDGLNCGGVGLFASRKYIKTEHINTVRYNNGFYVGGSSYIIIDAPYISNCIIGCRFFTSSKNTLNFITINNCGSNNTGVGCLFIDNSCDNKVTAVNIINSMYDGLSLTGSYGGSKGNKFYSANVKNNLNKDIDFSGAIGNNFYNMNVGYILFSSDINYLYNTIVTSITPSFGSSGLGYLYSQKHNGTVDNHWVYTWGGTINSQTAVRHSISGLAWKLSVSDIVRTSDYPVKLSVAKIAVNANKLVTVKAWVKKSHASDIGAKLVCLGNQIGGVDNDIVVTKADDTDWEELTVTFTPNEKGTVEIEFWGYWVANLADESVYIDDLTITQTS